MEYSKISAVILGTSQPGPALAASLQAQGGLLQEIFLQLQHQPVAYNNGANRAKGDWLAFIPGQTSLAATCFETVLWAAAAMPQVGAIYTDYFEESSGKTIEYTQQQAELLQYPPAVFFVKKEVWQRMGGLAEQLPLEQSLVDFWQKMIEQQEDILHLAAPLFTGECTQQAPFLPVQGAPHTQGESVYSHTRAIWGKPFTGIWKCPMVWPVIRGQRGKNLLLMLPHMVLGGADQFNLDLMDGLLAEGWHITVVTTLPEKNTWRNLFLKRSCDIFELPAFLGMEAWPAFIQHLITSRSISHLLLTNSYFGYYLAPLLRLQFPQLVIADYIHMEEWYYRGGGYAKPSAAVGEFLDKTFACNENTRKVLLTHFGRRPDTVQTVYIGVDAAWYNPENIPTGALYQELGLAPDRPVILFPCRITPQKRPLLLLQIAQLVQQQHPNVAFVVAGNGVLLEEMRRKTKELQLENTVYFAGEKKDLRFFYQDATITLVCSLKEGLSLTSYESLAMGTPVVTSEVGGQGELVDFSVGAVVPLLEKEDGQQTPAQKEEANRQEALLFAKEIGMLLANQKRYWECKNNARTKILQGFTTQNMQGIMASQLAELQTPHWEEKRNNIAHSNRHLQPLLENYLETYMAAEAFEREKQEQARQKDYFQAYYIEEGHPSAIELNRIRQLKSFRLLEGIRQSKVAQSIRKLFLKK